MRIALIFLFLFYFCVEFVSACCSWTNSKSNKEYFLRLFDTLFSAGLIFAFLKLMEVC